LLVFLIIMSARVSGISDSMNIVSGLLLGARKRGNKARVGLYL